MQKIKSYWHEFKLWWWKDRLIHSLYFVIGTLILFLFIVGFETFGSKEITWFLGTEDKKDGKKETIEFIAFGIGGMLAAMGAIAIHHRAEAQIKNADAQTKNAAAQIENNKLIEKGYTNERFKSATEHLGNKSVIVRISAFYQFYYLAKEHTNADFRKSIFDILCSHLRNMTTTESYKKTEGGSIPTEECQTLLNILFRTGDIFVFAGFDANMTNVYLRNADLLGANLLAARLVGANLSAAHLIHADLKCTHFFQTNVDDTNFANASFRMARLNATNFKNVSSIKGADFRGATMDGKPISQEHLPDNKGEYYADWNPPPKKEEN